jgi:hypothetical protein
VFVERNRGVQECTDRGNTWQSRANLGWERPLTRATRQNRSVLWLAYCSEFLPANCGSFHKSHGVARNGNLFSQPGPCMCNHTTTRVRDLLPQSSNALRYLPKFILRRPSESQYRQDQQPSSYLIDHVFRSRQTHPSQLQNHLGR